ncbi:hypothetical protein GALL_451090 [mine drainage metagenome]|uniref:Uncharacterized protein n=1 Tax=mine drainage metagenome TaxID=410659 RepID=A0A1J5PR30_9ZZZZ
MHRRAEPLAVELVGEQRLLGAERNDRHCGVQSFEHGDEALVRRSKLLPDAGGLGDVGDRHDPAGLAFAYVDQRGHIDAGVEFAAILAADLERKAGRRGQTVKALLDGQRHFSALLRRPVRVGWAAAQQVDLFEPGHAAEREVDVLDAALHVHRLHAGGQRVFDGTAEGGLACQCVLRAQPLAQLVPARQQRPESEGGEQKDAPVQTLGGPARAAAVAADLQHQSGIEGRKRRAVLQRLVANGLAGGADQQLIVRVQQRHGVTRAQVFRNRVAQNAVDRVDHAHNAGKLVLPHHRGCRFHQPSVVGSLDRARVRRALADQRLLEQLQADRPLEGFADQRGRLIAR